ncbi:hypothetical protein CIB84_007343 [Bambusicola thoracicus]|uniref:Immunoglobulin V-set domain-containing protein n=1 Tax=Bambusicola thoracicus TaxID=9083 RepID=A0A2P4SXR5_BAMTH|nr:hypothetical protein CIB84_007343 [Bambusicola thoracicus]
MECIVGTNSAGSGTEYGVAVKGCDSIRRDNVQSTVRLQLNDLRAEDTGVYYCAPKLLLVVVMVLLVLVVVVSTLVGSLSLLLSSSQAQPRVGTHLCVWGRAAH